MGSSAASAAAGAWAVNALFGAPLSKEQLVIPGLISEATVSGYHADNIAPALLGGFILIRYNKFSLRCHDWHKCFCCPGCFLVWLATQCTFSSGISGGIRTLRDD